MKPNAFAKKNFEKAKETTEREAGLARMRARKGRQDAAAQCVTPALPVSRKQPMRALKLITTISAQVDTGFGNALFIRGQGAGLSWEKGQPLECIDATSWKWSSSEDSSQPVVFKLLINDQQWCRGENMIAAPGVLAQVAPLF